MGLNSPYSRPARAFWWGLSLLLLILSLTSCAPEAAPDLIDINRVDPPVLEAGTELRVEGLGFVEHGAGTLRLKGTLFSPGRTPQEVNFSRSIQPETRSLIAVRLKEREINEILAGAHHGTFKGKLEISFEPVMEGRPTLHGTRDDLTLNLFAESPPSSSNALSFLNYLGLKLSSTFVIEQIEPKSIAAQAGLFENDRLYALDGVHLDSLADFVPAPHMGTSTVNYSRGDSRLPLETQLHRADFQLLDTRLIAKGLAFALGLALALILAARPPRFLVWMMGPRLKSTRRTVVWLEGVRQGVQALAYLSFALVSVCYVLLLGGGIEMLQHFDFLVVLSSGILAILIGAFVLGGSSASRRFSLLGALSSTALAGCVALPIIIAALARSAEIGSLELVEIDAAQGVFLPHIGALHSPWSLVLSIAYLLALVPLSGRRPPVFGIMGESGRGLLLGRLLEWTGLLILLALWLSLFGGAQLEVNNSSHLLQSGFFTAKLAAFAYLIAALRARVGYLRMGEAFGLWGMGNIVVSGLGAGLLVLSWTRLSQGLTLDIKSSFSVALFGSFLLFSLVAQARSWVQSGRGSDPWI